MDKKEKNTSIYTITDPLLEPYFIQYDQNCYTAIKKIKAGTSDRVRDTILGYYAGIDRCLDAIAEDSIKNQDYTSLGSFVKSFKARIQELKQVTIK